MSTTGVLRISPEDVYPGDFQPGERERFFIELKPGEGVAGRVFEDKQIRYLPRTFLPSRRFLPKMSFPHAIKIGYELRDVEGKPFKELHLVEEEIEDNCFKAPNGPPPFRSFLSVPLQTDENKCIGVLNFDFHRSRFLVSVWLRRKSLLGQWRVSRQVQKLLGSDLKTEFQGRIPLQDTARGLRQYVTKMTAGKVLLVAEPSGGSDR